MKVEAPQIVDMAALSQVPLDRMERLQRPPSFVGLAPAISTGNAEDEVDEPTLELVAENAAVLPVAEELTVEGEQIERNVRCPMKRRSFIYDQIKECFHLSI